MADNLEHFFKKHLEDESPGEDNWNVPSDKVWEKALPEFQKKSGIFIPWKYMFILGIVALIGFSIIFFVWNYDNGESIINNDIINTQPTNNQQNNNVTAIIINDTLRSDNDINERNNLTESNTQLKETTNVISKSEFKKNQVSSNNTEDIIIVKEKSRIDLKPIITENNTQQSKKDIEIGLVKVEGASSLEKPSKDVEEIEKKNQVTEIDIVETNPIEVAALDPQSSVGDTLENQKTTIKSEQLSDTITTAVSLNKFGEAKVTSQESYTPNFNNKGKLSIGAFFSPTYTATYLDGDLISGIVNTSPVFLYSSNYGLELRYYLSNKLSFVLGVGKSEIKSWSRSSVDFSYNISTEHIMETGEKENTSPIPMPTPFGELSTEVTYRFDASDEISDGEILESQLETHQKILYLSIPLGVEYNIINRNRLNWFAEGGIRFNRSVQDGSEFTSTIFHLGNEMKVMGENIASTPNYKEIYLNYYLGTGISYRLSDLFQINTSVRYFGNINKVNLQDNMTTNVRGFDLKIGINYFF